MRTIELTNPEGVFRIEVPDDSKVTFGPALPNPRTPHVERVYCVRVYKGKTEKAGLLACFPDVVRFRDLSMPILRPMRGDEGKEIWVNDESAYRLSKQAASRLQEKHPF